MILLAKMAGRSLIVRGPRAKNSMQKSLVNVLLEDSLSPLFGDGPSSVKRIVKTNCSCFTACDTILNYLGPFASKLALPLYIYIKLGPPGTTVRAYLLLLSCGSENFASEMSYQIVHLQFSNSDL